MSAHVSQHHKTRAIVDFLLVLLILLLLYLLLKHKGLIGAPGNVTLPGIGAGPGFNGSTYNVGALPEFDLALDPWLPKATDWGVTTTNCGCGCTDGFGSVQASLGTTTWIW